MRKFWRISAGVGLVILGIIGCILPIMPGLIFLVPGLVILAEFYPPLQRLVDWAKAKLDRERKSHSKPSVDQKPEPDFPDSAV